MKPKLSGGTRGASCNEQESRSVWLSSLLWAGFRRKLREHFSASPGTLTNIHRHSGAKHARIRLSEDAYALTLEIQDNGRGIPADAKEKGADTATPFGVGIPGMIERMKQLGGRLEIDSGTLGTTVYALLPVSLTRRIQG